MRGWHALSFACVMVCATALTGCGRWGMFSKFTGQAFVSLVKPAEPAPVRYERPVVPGAHLVVTWVGHATALIQMDDKLILTDPVFTRTVGQIAARSVEPGIRVDALPPLDAVLVSHMHMDHLSFASLDMIEDRTRALLIPRGGMVYVPRSRVRPIEVDTWQYWEADGLRVTAVPVSHTGWRYGFDRDYIVKGFTGYVIEYRGMRVYFGGDTAYDGPAFRTTTRALGKIDVALIPIAPIEPSDLMRRYHTDPGEALDAFADLGAAQMVPIHYDTFFNAIDEPGAAPNLLRHLAEQRGVADRVKILRHGERYRFR